MKRASILFGLASTLLGNAQAAPGTHAASGACRGSLLYFASMATGADAGITGARLDPNSGRLCSLGIRASLPKPVWIIAPPGDALLYAASEISDPAQPSISAFRVDAATGRLDLINRATSGGAAVSFTSVNPASRTVFAAHWVGGQISALPILTSGGLDKPATVIPGRGTGPNRVQAIPRTHAIVAAPGNRFVLVTDFSGDRIAVYRYDAGSRGLHPNDPSAIALAPGSGPRHIVFSPDGKFVYVINQLSSTIITFAWDGTAGSLSPAGTVPTIARTFTGQNDAAELLISRDGKWLYISNRGEDTIVVFAVDPASGLPVEQQRIASGGETPRAIDLDRSQRWLLASNQASNRVNVFARNPTTGMLRPTANSLSVPLPAGAAFVGTSAKRRGPRS